MVLEILNPFTRPEWDRLAIAHPACSFFHSSAWARVLSEAYGYKPCYATAFGDNGLFACLPMMEVSSFITGKRGVSLPFTDSCEPLVGDRISFNALMDTAKEYGKKAGWDYLEIRGGSNFFAGTKPSVLYLGHTLDLTPGESKLFSGFSASTRRNVRKAEKESVEVVISTRMEAMMEFCLLNRITRKQHGLPAQPLPFFRAVQERVLSKGLGFIAQARYQGNTIAASVFFVFGRTALYKFGASAMEYQRLRANNLVMWEAIKHLTTHGIEILSFGRTDPEQEGLRRFKLGWGAQEHAISYYHHALRQNRFARHRELVNDFGKNLFRKLPLPMLNAIGSLVYRHTG